MHIKYKFLLFVLVVMYGQSSAQYLPVVQQEGLWSSVRIHCNPTGSSFSSVYFKFDGDTAIDQITYKKYIFSEDSDQQNWFLWGFFREDTISKKVYYRPVLPDNEGLVYDFGVSPGDKVVIENFGYTSGAIQLSVLQVDTVFWGGVARKQILLIDSISFQTEIWVEGIGSLFGLLNAGVSFQGAACGGEALLCYSENNNLVYHDPAYSVCFFEYTSVPEEPESKSLILSPNPVTDFAEFNLPDADVWVLRIYSLSGDCVFSKEFSGKHYPANLANLAKGYYIGTINSVHKSMHFSFIRQ
jgi:hypothetical protein